MQLKIPIPLGLNYHYESRKANFSPLGFQDLEWETKTIHEGYQGPSSPRAYQLEKGWGITATLKGVLVGRYASLKKNFFFFCQRKKLGKSLNFYSCNIITGSCAMLGPHYSWHQLTRLSFPQPAVTCPGISRWVCISSFLRQPQNVLAKRSSNPVCSF